jgi:hypothetical protein
MPSKPADHSGLDDGAGDFEIAARRSRPSALPSPVTTVALMLGAGFAALGSLMSFLRLAVVQNGHDSHAGAHAHATPADQLSSSPQAHFLDLNYSK